MVIVDSYKRFSMIAMRLKLSEYVFNIYFKQFCQVTTEFFYQMSPQTAFGVLKNTKTENLQIFNEK